MRRALLGNDESNGRDHRDGSGEGPAGPPVGESPGEPGEHRDGEDNGRHVEAVRRVGIAALRGVAQQPQNKCAERYVEPEAVPPVDADEPATHDWPRGGGDAEHAAPCADGLEAVPLPEGGLEHRETAGRQGRGGDTLDDAGAHEQVDRWREGHCDGGDDEAEDTEGVDALATEVVTQRATDDIVARRKP